METNITYAIIGIVVWFLFIAGSVLVAWWYAGKKMKQ